MAIYSVCLAHGSGEGPANVAVYTAPEAGTVVVRDIALYLVEDGADRVAAYTVLDGTLAYLMGEPAQPGKSALHWQGRQILRPGEVIHVVTSAEAVFTWRISGYLLGVAP